MFPFFTLFGRTIGMYGVCAMLGFFAAGALCVWLGRRFQMEIEDIILLFLVAAGGLLLGGHGCAYSVGNAVHYAGIYKVPRVDTTAAGDSFIGGLCAKLCEGAGPDEAVSYAAAVSAITVSRKGAAVSIPTAEEVKAFLAEHTIGPHHF